MNQTIKTYSTSLNTTQVSPIILRSNNITRLVFHPLLIDENKKNPEAQLKGCFVFQRKGIKDNWEDIKEETLSSLKKGEGYTLELSSEEFLKLINESKKIQELYKKYGYSHFERVFTVTEGNVEGVFLQIADPQNSKWVIENLKHLENINFENLNNIIGVAKIENILEEWERNKNNSDEKFWQDFLHTNFWILQQVFSYPIVLLQGETYVGGKNSKGRNGKGGVVTDFLGQDQTTNSLAVIEIKTPCSKLIGGIYRGDKHSSNTNESYSIDGELSGAIVQLQNQINTAITNFKNTLEEDFREEQLNHICPHGILIIGCIDNLTLEEKKSLFLFRKTIKDITIITFDEMFKKINLLKKVFYN